MMKPKLHLRQYSTSFVVCADTPEVRAELDAFAKRVARARWKREHQMNRIASRMFR